MLFQEFFYCFSTSHPKNQLNIAQHNFMDGDSPSCSQLAPGPLQRHGGTAPGGFLAGHGQRQRLRWPRGGQFGVIASRCDGGSGPFGVALIFFEVCDFQSRHVQMESILSEILL